MRSALRWRESRRRRTRGGLRTERPAARRAASVVSLDNIFGSGFSTPSLSTAGAPLHALGATAVQQLAAQINGAPPHIATPGMLLAQLVVRQSTAPPPRRP